jgi:hypothetical protein
MAPHRSSEVWAAGRIDSTVDVTGNTLLAGLMIVALPMTLLGVAWGARLVGTGEEVKRIAKATIFVVFAAAAGSAVVLAAAPN